jgi:TPP-dependent 2-oxoacid decarboxylase
MSLKTIPWGKTTLGKYIFRRVSQLGVRHVFGVPGDFNRL